MTILSLVLWLNVKRWSTSLKLLHLIILRTGSIFQIKCENYSPPFTPWFASTGSEPPSPPQVVEDGGEEDEEELSGGEEADLRSSSGRGSLLTRRGITLRVLLKDGLVEPGDGVLAIHYLVSAQLKSQGQ